MPRLSAEKEKAMSDTNVMALLAPAKLRLIPLIYQHEVIKIDTKDGFRLASGQVSPVYLDHRRLFGIPDIRDRAIDLWVGAIRHLMIDHPKFVVAGTATAGIAPAFALAERLHAPFAYIRSGIKKHGLGQSIEGAPIDDAPVLVVDDMVTTGGSLLQACKTLVECDHQVVLTTSFTSKFPRTNLTNEQGGLLPFVSLFTLRELLECAKGITAINTDDLNSVLQWLSREELNQP